MDELLRDGKDEFDDVGDSDETDENEEDQDDILTPTSTLDEPDNHWLVKSVNRIRRSIGDLLGGSPSKLEDDVEKHTKKMQKRKGKGKGKNKGKKNKNKENIYAKHLIKTHEKHSTRQDKKARMDKHLEEMHRPVSRIRRQHLISNDDEDLADGSGSGASFVTNRLCK